MRRHPLESRLDALEARTSPPRVVVRWRGDDGRWYEDGDRRHPAPEGEDLAGATVIRVVYEELTDATT